MAFGQKERIDYWPDYYAFLGIARDADAKIIDKAIAKQLAGLHPDANHFATDGIKEVLERIRHHVTKAQEVLTNPDLKAKLDAFLIAHPDRIGTISNSGTLQINMMPPLFPEEVDLDALLIGTHVDHTEFAERALQMAGASTGAGKSLRGLRIAYKHQPQDADIQQSLREALVAELTLTTLQLGAAWGDAGMQAKMHAIADAGVGNIHDAAAEAASEIEDAAANIIPSAVQLRADRLLTNQSAPPLLLPAPDGSHTALTTLTEATIAQATQLAQENFRKRTHRIKELRVKQAGLVGELLDLSQRYEVNGAGDAKSVIVHIMNDVQHNPPQGLVSMRVTLQDGEIVGHENLSGTGGKTAEELKALYPDERAVGIGLVPECLQYLDSYVYHALHREGLLAATAQAPSRG